MLAARHDDDGFYSIIVICLSTVIWFQVTNNNHLAMG